MKTEVFLLTRNSKISQRLKYLPNAKVCTVKETNKSNKLFKKNGSHLEVALLDLTYSEHELNKFIFYMKQNNKRMPVVLLGAKYSNIESEAMRNLDVYGYIKHPEKINEIKEILDDLNRSFELDMDKKFERVDYLEKERVFVCTFKDMQKFFLKRSQILDNVASGILNIGIDKSGYHFAIHYASGESSVVPWDFVKSLCDDTYKFYQHKIQADPSKEIAAKIRKYRKLKKLTQEELAVKTGIHRANVARIENGKHRPYLETIEKIAKALGVSTAHFVAH